MGVASVTLGSHGIKGIDKSYWLATIPDTHFPVLRDGLNIDVAIIGGGLVGIITALFLKETGLNVAVIEARHILEGVTGNTTAKITSLHRLIYHNLINKHGMEKAGQFADSNQAAIDRIESLVKERGIECDFSRLPFYTYALTDQSLDLVEKEVTAAQKLNLPVSFKAEIKLPFPTRGAVCFENQAQFHPGKFILALANSIPGNGSYIFENSRVNNINYGDTCTVISEAGKIKARSVVIATNFPIFDKEGLYFARIQQSRSYAVACGVDNPPQGMYIDADAQGYAWRFQPWNGKSLLILSGSDHIAGHGGDLRENYRALERMAGQTYNNTQARYSWSTQDGVPYDGAPFIGKLSPLHNNVYVATGFGKWGMTTSVVAGTIITDMIRGKANPWVDVYNPLRFKADASSAKKLISENTHVAQMYIEGHFTKLPDISELNPGEGKIVKENGQRVAAYKDDLANVHRVSPYCTHMGCVVNWNNAERTWDCPCHGSRYTYTGEIIHSPAVRPIKLKGKNVKENKGPVI